MRMKPIPKLFLMRMFLHRMNLTFPLRKTLPIKTRLLKLILIMLMRVLGILILALAITKRRMKLTLLVIIIGVVR